MDSASPKIVNIFAKRSFDFLGVDLVDDTPECLRYI